MAASIDATAAKHEKPHSLQSSGAVLYSPVRPHYEWMGPPGALLIMLLVPAVMYALYFLCSPHYCLTPTHWPWQSVRCPTICRCSARLLQQCPSRLRCLSCPDLSCPVLSCALLVCGVV